MSILDKKGINVTSGFKLISGQPIDARQVVEDETELQSIIDNGAAYEGLEVWVKSVSKKYRYVGSSFVEVAEGGGGESTNAIIDVNELPKPQWVDSIVPNTGYVEKVYLNTSLSNEEVLAFMNEITSNGNNNYNFLLTSNLTIFLQTFNNYIINDAIKLSNGDISGVYWVSPEAPESMIEQVGYIGWNPSFNGIIEVNSEVVSTQSDDGVTVNPVGNQNSSISHLFSNEQVAANVNENAIYRLKEFVSGDIIGGAAIPNSGEIKMSDVAINFNLSIEETVAYFEQLTLVDISSIPNFDKAYVPLAIDFDGNNPAFALCYSSQEDVWLLFDTIALYVFFASKPIEITEMGISVEEAGWNKTDWEEYKTLIEENYGDEPFTIVPVESDFSDTIGVSGITWQNDKLSNVFFIKPFVYENAVYKYSLWNYVDGQWLEVNSNKEDEIISFTLSYTYDSANNNAVTFAEETVYNLKKVIDKIIEYSCHQIYVRIHKVEDYEVEMRIPLTFAAWNMSGWILYFLSGKVPSTETGAVVWDFSWGISKNYGSAEISGSDFKFATEHKTIAAQLQNAEVTFYLKPANDKKETISL